MNQTAVQASGAVIVLAVAQLVVAGLLAWLTYQYVKATREIAQSNRIMADANRAVVAEMQAERSEARLAESKAAVRRLAAVLLDIRNLIRHGQSVGDWAHEAWERWRGVYNLEKDIILDPVLAEDLTRFDEALLVVTHEYGMGMDWPMPEAQTVSLIESLRKSLAEHRRGGPVSRHRMPISGRVFEWFASPPGVSVRNFMTPLEPHDPDID